MRSPVRILRGTNRMKIELGGKNEERLYLQDLTFKMDNEDIVVKKTDMPDMKNIIHRHIARYLFAASFTRPGMRVLDFPCGSGYGYQYLSKNAVYEGMDNDRATIYYCCNLYHNSLKTFMERDLKNPKLEKGKYDLIACIEGLEHIEEDFQDMLILDFHKALKPGGLLVVTTPEANESGPNKNNKFHLWERTERDFMKALSEAFEDITIFKTKDKIHNETVQTMMYAICRRG